MNNELEALKRRSKKLRKELLELQKTIKELEIDDVPSFREMLDICEHYPYCSNKKANWYCGDCQMIICLSCKSRHENHEILKELSS